LKKTGGKPSDVKNDDEKSGARKIIDEIK